jgi:subtilisin family serine protease
MPAGAVRAIFEDQQPKEGVHMVQGLIYSVLLLLMSSCGSADDNVTAKAPSDLSCGALSAQSLATAQEAPEPEAPGTRFIVKPRGGEAVSAALMVRDAQAVFADSSVEALDSDLFLVKTAEAVTSAELASRFPAGEYEFVEPDYVVTNTLASNDPYYPKQWAHGKVHSPQAWDVSQGEGVTVAVVDSGVDYTHPDLRDNMWVNSREIPNNGIDDDGNGYVDDIHGWNFVSKNNQPKTEVGGSNHGSHVGGTIGAVGNNRIGVMGHAPRVKIMALKFLGKSGSGYTSDAVKAIDYAVRNGAKVINNSWGSYSKSTAVSQAIDRARAAGVLFVAAAGNSGKNNDSKPFYPASFPQDNVVRVASSTSADKLSSFSNYGAKTVDLAAPGSNIYSTVDGNSYATKSGTSMASPLVSGVLATMVSLRPDLDYRQIKAALLGSVDKLSAFSGRVKSGGRINALRAVNNVSVLPAGWQPPPGACR